MTNTPILRLLDADVVIDIQHRHPPALAWFSSLTANPSVPGIAVMELYQGARSKTEEREVEVLLAPLPVVWPTEADCQRALVEFRRFHLSHRLSLLDALIAATAIGLGATLCTFNAKHYKISPGWFWNSRMPASFCPCHV